VRNLHEESREKEHEKEAKEEKKKTSLMDLEESIPDGQAEKKRSALVLDKTKGFMKYQRRSEKYRPAKTRTRDWAELSTRLNEDELKYQTARCMDCGVPFCQSDTGCPISNIIPKWNELVFVSQDHSFDLYDHLLTLILAKPMARRPQPIAHDKQFPRVHWPCLPSTLRGCLCFGHH
jgi:hypothetical protein